MATEIRQISTSNAAKPVAAYSQAIEAGPYVFVSGQVPLKADGVLVEGSIHDQTVACIESLKAILEAAGSGLDRIVKNTIFITDMANFKEVNEAYAKYFSATKPARSCVAVKQLPMGVPVEIESIALAGSKA